MCHYFRKYGKPFSVYVLLLCRCTLFFRLRVDVNDLLATEKLAPLNDAKEGPPVFFVHSIEGIATPLKNLGAQLTIPAYCFQSIPSAPHDCIENLAKFYIQVNKLIFRRLSAKHDFDQMSRQERFHYVIAEVLPTVLYGPISCIAPSQCTSLFGGKFLWFSHSFKILWKALQITK